MLYELVFSHLAIAIQVNNTKNCSCIVKGSRETQTSEGLSEFLIVNKPTAICVIQAKSVSSCLSLVYRG